VSSIPAAYEIDTDWGNTYFVFFLNFEFMMEDDAINLASNKLQIAEPTEQQNL